MSWAVVVVVVLYKTDGEVEHRRGVEGMQGIRGIGGVAREQALVSHESSTTNWGGVLLFLALIL